MIVWLASYPRSGNTFFRVILNSVFDIKTYSIYDDKGDIGADEKTSKVVGHEFLPENFDIQKARDEEKTYYIKTHELLDNRVDDNDKVIYLIRDGRESTLSFTKHQNTFDNQKKKIIDTIYGNIVLGSWGEHVNSWNPKYRDNTLLIKFENLIKEPIEYIGLLAEFLQIESLGGRIPTFEELKRINPKFFRSGKTNSWEDIYSDEEHMAFWLKNYNIMADYGYDYKKLTIPQEVFQERIILEIVNQNNYLMNFIFDENKKLQAINSRLEAISQKSEQNQKIIDNQTTQLPEKQKNKQDQLLENNKQLSMELKNITNSKRYKFATFIAYPYLKIMGKL